MAETILSIRPGIGSRLDDQAECAVPEAAHSNPEAGRVARLLPIEVGQWPVIADFLSYARKTDLFSEAPEGDQHWRNQADGVFE